MPNLLTAPSRPPGASGRGSWKGCEYRRVDQAVGRDSAQLARHHQQGTSRKSGINNAPHDLAIKSTEANSTKLAANEAGLDASISPIRGLSAIHRGSSGGHKGRRTAKKARKLSLNYRYRYHLLAFRWA